MQIQKKLYIFKHFSKRKKLFFCQYLSFFVRLPVSLTQTDAERHTNDRRKAVIRRRGRQTDKHRDRRIRKKNDEKTKRRGESAEKGETQHQE